MSCHRSSIQGSRGKPTDTARVQHAATIHQALPATKPCPRCLLCKTQGTRTFQRPRWTLKMHRKTRAPSTAKQLHLEQPLCDGCMVPNTTPVTLSSMAPTTACCARHYRGTAVKVTPAEVEKQHKPPTLHSSSITAGGSNEHAQVVIVANRAVRRGRLDTPCRQLILSSPPPATAQRRLKVPASCLDAGLQPLLEGADDGIRGAFSEELQEPFCPLLPCTRWQLLQAQLLLDGAEDAVVKRHQVW